MRASGYVGIDIEGWHDPVYRADRETTGQVRGLTTPRTDAEANSSQSGVEYQERNPCG